ncbi:MAG: 1-acyl-sn-glycerol-3-phosphate acyltransferase, partial [Chloroflexi bacterium]|nr:1-acyl-sn-glycerol-3-phosphate acyltransferase [Chloroflexota bacterium]
MTATSSTRGRLRPSYKTSPVVYAVMRWIIGRLMHVLYRYEIQGQENFPPHGAVIVAVNHLHILDPAAVAPAVSRQIVTLAADKWQHNFLINLFLRLAGSIFVQRGEVDRKALRACFEVLENGGVLAIAPEGTRSKTGRLQRAKPGVAYLATRTDAVIVPVAFWGVEKLRQWLKLRRPRCQVIIGKPFRLLVPKGKLSTDDLQELADVVAVQIGRLLPEEYRGIYAERIAA